MTLRVFSMYAQWAGSFIICLSCLPLFRQRSTHIKVIFYYALSSIFFQAAQQVSVNFFKNAGVNQIGNGFVLFEAVLLSLVFFFAVEAVKLRKVTMFFIIGYVVFYAVSIQFFYTNSHAMMRFARDIIMVLLSVGYFFYLINKLPEKDILRFPMFWINTGILIFFSGTSILSLMLNYIVNVLGDDLKFFWTFRNFFRFGFCLMLSYACWLDYQNLQPTINTRG
jgi:hypothetical protein